MLNKREGNVLLTPSALGPVVVASAALFTAGCGGGADTGSATSQTASVNCSDLSSVTVADTTFTLTKSMPTGDFAPPTGATIKDLPAFCRVAATVKPTSDSNIKVELWLPTAWNGKYLGTGNGGLGGTIDYEALANGLRRGFAVANTDLGTSAGVASMVGHVETIVDFGHRATHLMTTLSKTLVNRFYARAPSYSYWFGCSTGGGQGMHEAQQYPEDYDGIVAGAPGAARVPAHLSYQWAWAATQQDQTSNLTVAKRKLWADHVMSACDELDGLKDGVIGRPDMCKVDPAVLQCESADAADCLTAGQVSALRKIYAGPTNPVTGAQLSYGYLPGTELDFSTAATTPTSAPPFPFPFQWVWGVNWDWRSFNWASDVDVMHNTLDFAVDASNPDLTAFAAHGGKLIVFQGLADGIHVPGAAIAYRQSVEKRMPGQSDSFMKLFTAPGMDHCRNGVGPNVFGNLNPGFPIAPDDPTHDLLAAAQSWVEKGRVPDQIIATKYANNSPTGAVERTMPLCPWPKVSRYNGTGDVNSADSFSCVDPS
ncbi:tannase/feruloyl esterase family alpha/beta hydrolase [Burkholderia multivorans]|uniref:tannase/feruloyl esterase family alpha/beta hydrolase n=1 Tax=Burkholderia multivorans TaxID=87883 RepID=UPI001C216CE5|nr:tannase/feruloyl esterase family alpha/beta hydrolase [Burkholderia multivorans]MBU9453143.1 tannase/feruloyl esterase family alpha/beta hydrolase [Burkholderia multivorans]